MTQWLLTSGPAHLILCADKGDDEGSAEDSDQDNAAASKQAGSAGQVAVDKTPVGMLQSNVGCPESYPLVCVLCLASKACSAGPVICPLYHYAMPRWIRVQSTFVFLVLLTANINTWGLTSNANRLCQAKPGAPKAKLFEAALVLCAGRALAYLKEQQKAVAGSSYLQLKPVILTTCKGTLQRLSKLPGWNRQSIRKKWVHKHSIYFM